MIRETVNSVLIEHGHEEYRNKLARLGLPPSDIAEMLASEEASRNGTGGIMNRTANAVFSEYLIFNTLPKDIADMHLAGEMHISAAGTWSLLPDTIFLDLSEVGNLDMQGRFPAVARLASLKSPDDMLTALPVLIPLLACEASAEVILEGVAPVLAKVKDADSLSKEFACALISSSAAGPGPMTTIAIPADTDSRQVNAMLDGYRRYVDATPTPRIGLSVGYGKKDALDHIAAAVRAGGIITMATGPARAASGIRKSAGKNSPAAMAFQSLSINLPRLAYESNRDETYFRAKLALMIKPALAALAARKKSVTDGARRGLLPAFASATQSMQHASSGIMANLTGAKESVYGILGHEEAGNGAEILQKVLKTAVEVAGTEGKKLGEESAAIAMIADDSAPRFAMLDSEKYGKLSLVQLQGTTPVYSQGMVMSGREMLSNAAMAKECAEIDKALNGGFAAIADVTDLSAADVGGVIEASSGLAFIHLHVRLAACAACGRKYKASLDRCDGCKSPHRLKQ